MQIQELFCEVEIQSGASSEFPIDFIGPEGDKNRATVFFFQPVKISGQDYVPVPPIIEYSREEHNKEKDCIKLIRAAARKVKSIEDDFDYIVTGNKSVRSNKRTVIYSKDLKKNETFYIRNPDSTFVNPFTSSEWEFEGKNYSYRYDGLAILGDNVVKL